MPAFQFHSRLNLDQSVSVPAEIAGKLRPNEPVQVVLLTGDADTEAEWRKLAAEQFLKGYAPGDDIYDQLSSG